MTSKQEKENDKKYEIIKKDCKYDISFKIIVIGNPGKKKLFINIQLNRSWKIKFINNGN
jgi:hypothetical protein